MVNGPCFTALFHYFGLEGDKCRFDGDSSDTYLCRDDKKRPKIQHILFLGKLCVEALGIKVLNG